jgi:hypothetical protein
MGRKRKKRTEHDLICQSCKVKTFTTSSGLSRHYAVCIQKSKQQSVPQEDPNTPIFLAQDHPENPNIIIIHQWDRFEAQVTCLLCYYKSTVL